VLEDLSIRSDAHLNAIRLYIHYCNHDRINLKLKGLSPVMYRIQP
jgi:putative transposase